MKKKTKLLIKIAGIIIILLFILIFAEIFGIGKNAETVNISVPKGGSAYDVATILKENNLIRSKRLYYIYARITKPEYKFGLHSFSQRGYKNISDALSVNDNIVTCNITVPEGYEMKEIAELFAKKGLCSVENFYKEAKAENFDYWFLKDIPKREEELEGYLFPDTYTFNGTESAHEIINVMLKNFDNKFTQEMKDRVVKTGLSADEIITLASIIEREASNFNEFKKVSGVFYNRLHKVGESYGFLESCATVQYILKERKSVLSVKDTEIDSPYNTYRYEGLPVGPICSPGLYAINAALYPEKTDYLYFVADGNGNHYFAKDYKTHLENTKKAGL